MHGKYIVSVGQTLVLLPQQQEEAEAQAAARGGGGRGCELAAAEEAKEEADAELMHGKLNALIFLYGGSTSGSANGKHALFA